MFKCTVIGNLGKDATINQVNGKNVINFSVASTEKWKDSSGTSVEKTTWIECAYWADSTNVAQYLKKGTQVYVEGSGDMRTWSTQDGKSGSNIACRVFTLQLLGSPKDNNGNNIPVADNQQQQEQQQNNGTAKPGVKLPF